MMQGMRKWSQYVSIASLISLLEGGFALAQQSGLTQAQVYDLGVNVQILLPDQSSRTANRGDELRPRDSLQTAAAANSFAKLQFNEGSLIFVDQDSLFYFRPGLRRIELESRLASNEIIFGLESGIALVVSPPNSAGTQVETPGARITIAAPEPIASIDSPVQLSQHLKRTLHTTHTRATHTRATDEGNGSTKTTIQATNDVATPMMAQVDEGTQEGEQNAGEVFAIDRSSAVMVVHDPSLNMTQVFALTDGDISVADATGANSVKLKGGETVAVTDGVLGEVQEFDLEAFYQEVALAQVLGPGQGNLVNQEPPPAQDTLRVVRRATLAVVRRQAFLRDALSGSDVLFTGVLINRSGANPNGEFVRTDPEGDDDDNPIVTGVFQPEPTPENPRPRPVQIRVNTDDQTIEIDGERGVSSRYGLSGNAAEGVVILENGRAVQIRVFNVDGSEPNPNINYPGSLVEGVLLPDQ